MRTVVQQLGWQAIEDEADASWTLLWTDCSIPVDRVMRLSTSQVGWHTSICITRSQSADAAVQKSCCA